MSAEFPLTGQGPAKVADSTALAKDATGFTHPNLHRRVDPAEPEASSPEVAARNYSLGIYGLNSHRTTQIYYRRDENELESKSEIP